MHLIGVREDEGWLLSRWELTYPVAWVQILAGVKAVYDYYDNVEVLIDDNRVEIKDREDIESIEERGNMTVRGLSKIVKVPISITFYNQLQAVDVNVPMGTEEFSTADYERFNHSLCQYMDSIEIAMFD